MSAKTMQLTEEVYHYLLSHSVKEHPVLTSLREKTAQLTGAGMQISPEQGQLMSFLASLINAKRCIDIGTFTGYSALVVALSLGVEGQVYTCDINQEATEIAQSYWAEAGMTQRIHLKLAPALQTLNGFIADGLANQFDFIFIDADKANYHDYYELSLQLLRQHGIILIDNVLWSGKVADDSVDDKQTNSIRELNHHIYQDDRVFSVMIPIGDGLTLVRKR